MTGSALLLSRAQFAFTIGFHILWPAYTIGLSGFIVIISVGWLRTGRPVYRALLRFWVHLFALGFAMGVVTGVVMSYQIGTNWSVFAERTANVIGPFFTYEVLTAFFLEAGFVGVMLFGMNRVSPRLHFVSCLAVALGAVISAFWILAANSWMQTPAGFRLEADGKFALVSWMDAIFTPSLPYRYFHMVTAAYLSGTFVVIGVCGFYLWRRSHQEFAQTGLSVALSIALVLVPVQGVLGDLHGRNSFQYQPIKVAAMEGDWQTRRGQHLVLFAWPDVANERNDYELAVPGLGSLILTHDWNGLVPGLTSVSPQERPHVPYVFFAFRIMVGLWFLMLVLVLAGGWLMWRRRLDEAPLFHFACVCSSPLPFLAVLCGWIVTEVGRQPYVVYGHFRTADAVSPVVASAVAGSFALFILVYIALLIAFLFYAIRTVLRGPIDEAAEQPAAVQPGLVSAPAGQAGE
ncbi:cytochrome ubiquinol oxidase subunit I [Bradyrhizobium rifense]|uniref:Cytochrome ubiquinol oxidase subunit I n=2 Tax=Bradyrhizobium rifense TaxID=515499 RepID=A0A5D3KN22_9BRAD|nr:cytochrome ubiquinol oxidase subunit I [Bradyrhizobium rifense]